MTKNKAVTVPWLDGMFIMPHSITIASAVVNVVNLSGEVAFYPFP